jgi:hypothetical protein
MAADEPMICAVTQANSCTKGEACTQGAASDVNLPLFLKISPAGKEILSLAEDGQRRVSRIKHSATDVDNRFVVYQGVEQGGAWSVVVNTSSGAMTISLAAGDTDAYIMYGACSRSLLKP